jgi:hypothetical protein
MNRYLKKHAAKMNTIALILMLVLPFGLYTAANQGSALVVKVLLGLFMLNMLFVMKS